jgi:hypothetical protein
MTQIKESISAGEIANEAHDESCYFCRDPREPEDNEVDDDAYEDEDAPPAGAAEEGIVFKNDSGKLGRALDKAEGTPDARSVAVKGQPYVSKGAAHHLIPGNASLKPSLFFRKKKFIWAAGGSGIGYNVNSEVNGVWLPGNYAMRGKWSNKGLPFKQTYAYQSIEVWRAQFHDSHPDYSDLVRETLDAVFQKLVQKSSIICPVARENGADPPLLFALVARLNTISARMRKKLELPAENWYKNVFTSDHSLSYMESISGDDDDDDDEQPKPKPKKAKKAAKK